MRAPEVALQGDFPDDDVDAAGHGKEVTLDRPISISVKVNGIRCNYHRLSFFLPRAVPSFAARFIMC